MISSTIAQSGYYLSSTKLLTKVVLNRIKKVLNEGQPSEQAEFRNGFSTIDNIHTVSKLTDTGYKMPLCLPFIGMRKAFVSAEKEAVL
ncbi:hypothetical protein RB195_025682 [Necator americanus]|uniref:Uncharacterized protein n=1 Tax=Necator americanus TaxID=51031 RepID=A0ABR1ETH0_NECAM